MAQHFLLSTAARTFSLAKAMRLTDDHAFDVFPAMARCFSFRPATVFGRSGGEDMGRWLLLAATAVLLTGCNQRGRYVVTPANPPIMTDSTNGETWILSAGSGDGPVWTPLNHVLSHP